mmetsp:Transcript_22623/g.32325  ORF Transcript_22623/g.32325 Transcript_22623/m.32325 type:complete len:164 (-) Transcript_22623:1397-1888(-)
MTNVINLLWRSYGKGNSDRKFPALANAFAAPHWQSQVMANNNWASRDGDDEGSRLMNADEGSPTSVDSALKTETLFPLSQHPSGSNSRVHPSGSNSRVGQNFRVATGAGAADEAAAPKRSSEMTADGDYRVAGSAGTSNKFAPSRRSSNPDYSTSNGQTDWNV